MNTYPSPSKPIVLPVAPREWPKVFRYTLLAITLIAFYWVFEIRFSFQNGSTLGKHHPQVLRTKSLTPIQGNGGQETVVISFPKENPIDFFQDGFIDSILLSFEISEPNNLHLPFREESSRLYYLQTNAAPSINFRLFFGDDPPEERFSLYSQWIDSIGEHLHSSPRELIRSYLSYNRDFLNAITISLPQVTDPLSTTRSTIPPLWKAMKLGLWQENKNQVFLRLTSPPNSSNFNNTIHPYKISLKGLSVNHQQGSEITVLWIIAICFMLVHIWWIFYRNERKTFLAFVFSMFSNGVWTLAFWRWFLQPLDFLLMFLIPLPFFFGYFIAIYTRKLSQSAQPDQTIRIAINTLQKSILGFLSISLLIILFDDGVISRLTIGTIGVLFGGFFAFIWSLAEWKLCGVSTNPNDLRIPFLKKPFLANYYFIAFYLIVGVILFLTKKSIQNSFTELVLNEERISSVQFTPYWIGPLEPTFDKNLVLTIRTQFPDLEIYHPTLWSLRELTKDEKQWMKPGRTLWTSLDTLRKKKLISDQEIEFKRDKLISSIYKVDDRIDNVVLSYPNDSELLLLWNNFQKNDQVISHITNEIAESDKDWFVQFYDRLFLSHLAMKSEAIQARTQFNSQRFIEWSKQFQLPNGKTIAILYSDLPQEQLQGLLPNNVYCSGPAYLKTLEQKSFISLLFGLLVLSLLIILISETISFIVFLEILFAFLLCLLGFSIGWTYEVCFFTFLYISLLILLIPYRVVFLILGVFLFIYFTFLSGSSFKSIQFSLYSIFFFHLISIGILELILNIIQIKQQKV